MSLTVKSVSFGNTAQSLLQQQKLLLNQPQQNQLPQQTQTVATQTLPQTQYVQTQPMMPVYQTAPVHNNGANTVAYVAGGLALVSLGFNVYSSMKGKSSQNMSENLSRLEQRVSATLGDKIDNLSQRTENAVDNLQNKIQKEINDRVGLGEYQDGVIGDLRQWVGKVEEMASKKATPVVVNKATNFLSREVEINGQKMMLANTLHGYGRATGALIESLRSEAANRMLGLVDRSKMVAPDKITIRVPTAEFKGIAKTGGMADVPREVIANLGAFINGKQDVRLVVDMPMYLGEVLYKANKEGGTSTFNSLKAIGNGKYNWVSTTSGSSKENVIASNLEKIADTKIPVYDDTARTMQDVEVYLARGIKQEVDANLIKQYLPQDVLTVYNQSIDRFNQAYSKFTQDTAPLRQEVETKLAAAYEKLADAQKNNASKDSIAAINNEIKEIQAPLEQAKKDFAKENSHLWEHGFVSLAGDGDGHLHTKIAFDGVFYKNEKFDMKGPRFDGADKTIYDDKAINSGESERFTYFDKYFYEFLTKSQEYTNERLGADLIIGNDWHTGGISAMMRLLTKAKTAVGDLGSDAAEKLYNTPVVTILHNARLAGQTAHSNPKLFNILFGEHSAMIAENAYMPDVYQYGLKLAEKQGLSGDVAVAKAKEIASQYGLPAKCWNGLMHEQCVNPQTMATAYSDVIVPVSDKYMEEIATKGVYGRENFELFRLRKFASDNGDQKTIVGITNGCDRVNNSLTAEGAKFLERVLDLPKGSLKVYNAGDNVLEWHNHNKKVLIDRVVADINNPKNPMKISSQDMTDLTGVNENTMIVSTAGRIVDQKGLDIFAESIEEFLKTHKFPDGNYPVFYAQGNGDKRYIEQLLAIKQKVANSPELGGQAAAKRIVFANLFSEAGRYDGCKLMSDFSIMSSWFEPCGLVHKQIASYSGAVPIVNETGGLTSGLKDGVDAIFSKFKPDEPSKEAVIGENKVNFAKAMGRAYELFTDKAKFNEVLSNSFNNDFSWLVKDGPMAQYVKVFTDLKVVKPQILSNS